MPCARLNDVAKGEIIRRSIVDLKKMCTVNARMRLKIKLRTADRL